MTKNNLVAVENALAPEKKMPRHVKKALPPKESYNLIEDVVLTATEFLYNGKITSNTNLAGYIKKLLEPLALVDQDKGVSIYNLSKVITIIEWLQNCIDKKRENDNEYVQFLLYKLLFPWQKEVFNDSCKIITMLCGRRSGKSFVSAAKMVEHCLGGPDIIDTPNGKVTKPRIAYYVGLTAEKAKEIMWPVLTTLVEKSRCKYDKIDNANLSISFSNGSEIHLMGNANSAQQEKLRGLDFSMVVIDEMQSQKGLSYFIDSVVGPILDGRNGTLIMSGTAPLTAATLWEEYIDNPAYSHYHVTMESNPTIPNHKDALQDVLQKHGWTEDNITYRREYLAEIAYDTNMLVLPKVSYYENIPADFNPEIIYVGLDYGFTDSTAFSPVVFGKRGGNLEAYQIHEYKESHMAATDIVQKGHDLHQLLQKEFPGTTIWFVADSSNGNVSQDLYNNGIPIYNAVKTDKKYQILQLKDWSSSGMFFIKKGSALDEESKKSVWKRNTETGQIIYEIDDSVYHPDMIDAARYAISSFASA